MLAFGAALVACPLADAEEVFTGQAAAAAARDSTWIAAPPQPTAVCIVDSGNDANPDTANVVARLSVDGGDGADLDGTGHHGTLMAMIASAPYNGFGMVGVAPSVRAVSVRAMRRGAGVFSLSDVLSAIDVCRNQRSVYNIKVVSLSLGSRNTGPLDAVTESNMRTAVDRAREGGLDVVAAAGNQPGAVDWPAAYAPVLAVGAADNKHVRCSFAADGAEVDLWAPGCPQDVALPDGTPAWASGSSEATAFVAGVLAQMRGLRPDLTPGDAEGLLTSTARSEGVGRSLDVAAAFKAAGLDQQLTEGHRAIPVAAAPPGSPSQTAITVTHSAMPGTPDPGSQIQNSPGVLTQQPPSVVAGTLGRLSKPRVRSVRHRNGQLSVVFKRKPVRVQARIQVYVRRRARPFPVLARTVRTTRDRLLTRLSGTLTQLSITYVDPSGRRAPSAPVTVRP